MSRYVLLPLQSMVTTQNRFYVFPVVGRIERIARRVQEELYVLTCGGQYA